MRSGYRSLWCDSLVAATIAFGKSLLFRRIRKLVLTYESIGLGIDKQDTRYVIHHTVRSCSVVKMFPTC